MKRKMILSSTVLILCLSSFLLPEKAFAEEENSFSVPGRVYVFGDDNEYEYSKEETFKPTEVGENTYGEFTILGDMVAEEDTQNEVPSYYVNEGKVSFIYSYENDLLTADKEEWHLVRDGNDDVADVDLDSNVDKGAVIVQTSKDGKKWMDDISFTDYFAHEQETAVPFFESKDIQVNNGCYYRVIIAYKIGVKTGRSGFLLWESDDYTYKRYAEVYEFYLYNENTGSNDPYMKTKTLGTVVNTGHANGYSGHNELEYGDVHYGWELGNFFVSGYTRETANNDGTPVFLKNVGDQITLWFNLEEDIDALNGDDDLVVVDDSNGYDQYFQINKTDMGRGCLIVRYTDEKGIKHEPEIYTDYLSANASTGADTIVRLFEEGDYEVALNYEVESVPRELLGFDIIPEYHNYRIFFKFSVRNGNCMVYPFDIETGAELSNEAITPNGFKLDMAKSRYLTIDVQKSVVTEGSNGFTEDVRFNRPAKDGDEYDEEGIYTFSVNNLYTGESTTKRIYVGDSDYMKALAKNKISVSELNELLAEGMDVMPDGTIVRTNWVFESALEG